MEENKAFTPGAPPPWRYERDILLDGEGKTIARLYGWQYGWSAEQRDINGNNLAKCPDLYAENEKLREALRQVSDYFQDRPRNAQEGRLTETINALLK
jgi:hypothetical protein